MHLKQVDLRQIHAMTNYMFHWPRKCDVTQIAGPCAFVRDKSLDDYTEIRKHLQQRRELKQIRTALRRFENHAVRA